MAGFHYPEPRFEERIFHFLTLFFTAYPHMRNIPGFPHGSAKSGSGIASVSAKIFLLILHNGFRNPALRHSFQLADIIPVVSGHDDGQRDATFVHKNMAFCSFGEKYTLGLRKCSVIYGQFLICITEHKEIKRTDRPCGNVVSLSVGRHVMVSFHHVRSGEVTDAGRAVAYAL
jgi:hypothetical protein